MNPKPAYTFQPHQPERARLGVIVAQCTALVFLGYFGLGLQAALLPAFVHQSLGLSTSLAGTAVGMQALATLVSRAFAGKVTDKLGARSTILWGFATMVVSGLLYAAATGSRARPMTDFAVLLVSRVLLGGGICWVSAAGAVWGIGRAGAGNASRVLVWSGVAANTSLALGAPVGLWIGRYLNALAPGLAVTLVAGLGAVFAFTLAEIEPVDAEPLHVLVVLRRVTPYGSILALSAVGYGTFAAFVTLFFQQQGWRGTAYPLALYGVAFVCVRVGLGRWVDRYTVLQVGLSSIALELGALALLASSTSEPMALASACAMGAGFSLLFSRVVRTHAPGREPSRPRFCHQRVHRLPGTLACRCGPGDRPRDRLARLSCGVLGGVRRGLLRLLWVADAAEQARPGPGLKAADIQRKIVLDNGPQQKAM